MDRSLDSRIGLIRLPRYAHYARRKKPAERARRVQPRMVHGTPITPERFLDELAGGSFCVSFQAHIQLEQCIALLSPESILLLDNGAFSHWKKGCGAIDRSVFWPWANAIQARCPLAVAIIPDVIGGCEEENWREATYAIRSRLSEYPERAMFVWHMDESIEGLVRAARLFNFIGIGSCAEYDVQRFRRRYLERLRHVSAVLDYVEQFYGRRPFAHLLRGLGILHQATRFDSADSANIARNHHRTRGEGQHVARFVQRIETPIRTNCIHGGRAYPTSNFAAPNEDPSRAPAPFQQPELFSVNLHQELLARVRRGETQYLNLDVHVEPRPTARPLRSTRRRLRPHRVRPVRSRRAC